MEFDSSLVLAVFLGILALLVILAFGVMITRALVPKPSPGTSLVASDAGHYEVAGKRICCSHCGSAEFSSNQILLNTWLLSLLRIDWLDSSATVLTCEKCGQLTWFSQESANNGK